MPKEDHRLIRARDGKRETHNLDFKAQFDLDYTSGEQAVKILKEVLSQPKDIVDEFSKYIKFGE